MIGFGLGAFQCFRHRFITDQWRLDLILAILASFTGYYRDPTGPTQAGLRLITER